MGREWPRYRVGQLAEEGCLLVEDGNHGEYRPRPTEFGAGETAFIRAADMTNGRILFETAERINQTALHRLRKGIGRGGDVLFSHKGTVGKLALVPLDAPPFVCSPQTTFWRTLDESRLDRRFLYYFLSFREFSEQWQARKGETDMADYVSLTAQRELRIAVPHITEQNAIGDVLGALDAKIELNQRMNRTLESITHVTFESWFVNFDPVTANAAGRPPVAMDAMTAALFPSHFDDSALGAIPAGWRVGTLGDVAEDRRRGVPPNAIDPSTPYIALEHMPKRSIALPEWGTAKKLESQKFRFKKGEILFGKLRPYFHKVGVAPVDGVCSTDIVVVAPRDEKWFGYVLGHVSSDAFVDHTNAGSTGTKMPRTSWGDMARYSVVLPPDPIVRAFSARLQASIGRIGASIHESRNLAALRDTLLPKLLSGEIQVREAEKTLERVGA